MDDINILQNQLIAALRELAAAEIEDESADKDYNETIARYTELFKAEHPAVVERARAASDKLRQTSVKVDALRQSAKAALTGDKMDDLPEGFKQTKEKTLVVSEFMNREDLRTAVLKEMPALLVVDMPVLEKLAFTVASDNGSGGFNLPSWLERLPVSVEMSYKASISDDRLKKLKPDEALLAEAVADEGSAVTTFPDSVLGRPLKNGESTHAYITSWTRATNPDGLYSFQSWKCVTLEDYPVSIIKHSVERINTFLLFEAAGYGDFLSAMQFGESQQWTHHPVNIEIARSGDYWRIIDVLPRPFNATPDAAVAALEPLVVAAPDVQVDDTQMVTRQASTVTAHIIGLKRGVTTNSQSPKWECTTLKPVPKGLRIFSHEDPKKDSYALFVAAGYDAFLFPMEAGESQNWIDHPIEVQIAQSADGWWNVVAVTPREPGAGPDAALARLKAGGINLLDDDAPPF